MTRPLHKCLSSARQLLIDWRNVLRRSGPPNEAERPGFDAEMKRFDEAIETLAEARDAARGTDGKKLHTKGSA